jgi:putative lipoic acid-binding regulatory protein
MNTKTYSSEELFNFPCDYSIKIFGKTCPELHKHACKIVQQHSEKLHPNQISSKQSSKGGYTSITIRIIALSRTQLDRINKDLQDCPWVAYVL